MVEMLAAVFIPWNMYTFIKHIQEAGVTDDMWFHWHLANDMTRVHGYNRIVLVQN